MSVILYEVHRVPIEGARKALLTREVPMGTYADEHEAFAKVEELKAVRAGQTREEQRALSVHPVAYSVRETVAASPPEETLPPPSTKAPRKRP